MEAAEQAVQKILAAEPNRYDALVMLGELLEARGDLTGCDGAYERAVRVRGPAARSHTTSWASCSDARIAFRRPWRNSRAR